MADAIRVLASPLACASEEEWRGLATEHARTATGLGSGVLTMADERGLEASTDGVDPSRLAAYAQFFPLLERCGVLARGLRLGVCTRREIYGPAYERLARTAYTQDFLPSIRSYDALSFIVPLVSRPRALADVVQLTLSVTERGRSVAEKQRQLGHLLYPALTAGIDACTAMRSTRSRLCATLDATGLACLVADRAGHIVHRTPGLVALCSREPKREALLALASRLALSFWSEVPTPRAALDGSAATYALSATEVHDGRDAYCVVAVSERRERRSGPLAPEAAARLGLTPRQAEVAVLLAERRTNREIAAALAISVHTARHHVEAVLERLGVPRVEVGRAIRPL